ncbi:Alpha/beta hydrolase fold-1 [Mycena belliarum]|uniref:Alpha/beta hydrolase fold-1 n=1 Tax=Mycena belliarum TaxID=1033014 RepID=A0AAD6U3L4_9AGAR|nr:Alpha/beta hydrolase fold-1 [Mycena belliae]
MPLSEVMSLTKQSSHLFTFCTSRPFLCIATKWTSTANSETALDRTKLCLVLLSGVGLTSSIWTPVVDRLYGIQAHPSSGQILGSVWAIERPSHGDSGVLNEAAFSGCDGVSPSSEYAAALAGFMGSHLLTEAERSNVAVISHSAGVAALVHALSQYKMRCRIRCLVLIEPTTFDECDLAVFKKWVQRVERFFSRKKTSWASVEQALSSNKSWNRFHKEVRDIIARTFFRPISGGVTTKTSAAQEIAALREVALGVAVGRDLAAIISQIHTHVIYGSRRDYWPKILDDAFLRCIQKYRPLLASVTPIQGEGHFAPQEAPRIIAASIYKNLVSEFSHGSNVTCKL